MNKDIFVRVAAAGLAVLCIGLAGCSKKNNKRSSSQVSTASAADGVQADEKVIMSGSYGYVDKGGYAMLVYNGDIEAENLDIPSSIGGLPVRELKEYLFANCENLKSVTIPSGVVEIGKGAFVECQNLESVVIPEGVTSVSEGLFKYCTSLKTVQLPASVSRIEDYAFAGCEAMESIYIPEDVSFIGTHAFSGCNPDLKSNIVLNIPTETYEEYGITGTFPDCQNWTADIRLSDKDNDGIFNAVVKNLEPGLYEFKVRANGEWTDSWGNLSKGQTYNSQENCSVVIEKKGSVEIYFDTNGEDRKLWSVYSRVLG